MRALIRSAALRSGGRARAYSIVGCQESRSCARVDASSAAMSSCSTPPSRHALSASAQLRISNGVSARSGRFWVLRGSSSRPPLKTRGRRTGGTQRRSRQRVGDAEVIFSRQPAESGSASCRDLRIHSASRLNDLERDHRIELRIDRHEGEAHRAGAELHRRPARGGQDAIVRVSQTRPLRRCSGPDPTSWPRLVRGWDAGRRPPA